MQMNSICRFQSESATRGEVRLPHLQPALAWLSLALATLLAGCVAAPPPSRAYVRPGASYDSLIPQIRRVGVVTDAVVRYDRSSTNDYFCIEDSIAALTNIVADAMAHLKGKGYEVAFAEGPLVGSFKKSTNALYASVKRHDKPTERSTPFYTAPGLAEDAAYQQALVRVMGRTIEAVSNTGELPTETFLADATIKESLKLISEKKQVDYLLVVVGDGLLVSGGKQAGQAIASALVSSLITLGNVVVSAHNVSFLDSYVALVNLKDGEVVWSNSLRLIGNPAASGLYRGNWGKFLLYYVPDRNPPKK